MKKNTSRYTDRFHYNDVIMSPMASQITSLTIVYSSVYIIQTQIKQNIKAPRHWPLCREFTGHRWIPRTKVSIWWRHHGEGNHRSPVDSSHKGTVTLPLMFYLMLAWSNWWPKSPVICDFSRIDAHITVTWWKHYCDVIMGAMASQITSLTIVYSAGRRSKKTSKFRVTGLCAGNSPVTGEFPAQMASNVENVFIW